MSSFETWMVGLCAGGLFVAFCGFLFTGIQLRRSAKANELSAEANRNADLMAVLSLESQLAGARYELSKVATRVGELGRDADSEAAQFLQYQLEEATEQYLNVTDRLCSCIVRGFIDENIYRRDYRRWIDEIVDRYKDQLGPGTRYSNIMRIHDAWKDEMSAQEQRSLTFPTR